MDLILDVISNGMDGEGIARHDGKVIFIDGAIEGEKVNASITKQNKNFARAELKAVVTQSDHRCNPKCKYYSKCGGCNMQHITPTKALEIKKQNVQNLFDKNKINYTIKNSVKSEKNYSYRNKLTLYLTKNNNLGFYQKNTNKLIDIDKCELVDENFNKIINILNLFFKNNKEINPFILKGVTIREVNGLFVLNFILNKKINLIKLEQCLKLKKIKYSLYFCINTKNNLPIYPSVFVGGESVVSIEEFGIVYPIYPMSFLQINSYVKTKIYSKILEQIAPNEIILDAYSGAGLLSAIMAKKAKMVYAVEIDESANRASKTLAKTNRIKNLNSICSDVKDVVPTILKQNKIDTIVLDPARKGVDDITLNAVANAGAKKIIYLSCNPATLTRDLKRLIDVNYKIAFAEVYDMFPQTSEVETLVVLEI